MSEDSPVGRFIERRGEGIHHICFRVTNLEWHLENLKSQGYRLVNETPVAGGQGTPGALFPPGDGKGGPLEVSRGGEISQAATRPRPCSSNSCTPRGKSLAVSLLS